MPTKYAPQLDHVGFDWGTQPDVFFAALFRRRRKLLSAMGFYREYGSPLHYKKDEARKHEARDLIRELAGILSHGAAVRLDGGRKATNRLIATIEGVEKDPLSVTDRSVEPEALAVIATKYQRSDEPLGTFWYDIYPSDIPGLVAIPASVRAAAVAAIVQLRCEASRGNVEDIVVKLLAAKVRFPYLRFNDACRRQSIAGSKKQFEGGSFFEFLQEWLQPLNQYLGRFHVKPISAAAVAREAAAIGSPRQPNAVSEMKVMENETPNNG